MFYNAIHSYLFYIIWLWPECKKEIYILCKHVCYCHHQYPLISIRSLGILCIVATEVRNEIMIKSIYSIPCNIHIYMKFGSWLHLILQQYIHFSVNRSIWNVIDLLVHPCCKKKYVMKAKRVMSISWIKLIYMWKIPY